MLLQLDVIRDENGKIRLGELTAIPCTYRNESGHNSFQPTPVEEGATYDRILKKLGGEFTGGNLNVDYSKLEPKPTPTTPPATEAPAPDSGSSGSGSNTTVPDSGSAGGSDTTVPDSGSSGGSDTSTPDSGSANAGSSADSGTDTGSSADAGTSSGSDTGSSDPVTA